MPGATITVTSCPVVGIAKLVERGPITKLAKLGEPAKGALPELPQLGAVSNTTLTSTTLLRRFDALTPIITLFQFVELGYLAPGCFFVCFFWLWLFCCFGCFLVVVVG